MQENKTLGARGRKKNQSLCYQVCKRKRRLSRARVGAGRCGEKGGGVVHTRQAHKHTIGHTAQHTTEHEEGKNTRGGNPKVVWRSPDILQGLGSLTYIVLHLYNRVTGDSGLG